MKPDNDPIRATVPVVHDPSADPDLRAWLAAARAEQVVAEPQLARLSQRFGALVGLELSAAGTGLEAPPAPQGLETIGPGALQGGVTGAQLGGGAKLLGGLASKVVLASLAAGASLWLVQETRPRDLTPTPAPAVAETVIEAAPAPVPEVQPVVPPAAPTVVEAAAPTPRKRAPARLPPVAESAPDELTLIREAQALRAQPSRALAALARHRKHYPDGVLAQEREVLVVEALVAADRRADAKSRAAAFVRAHPSSVHLARLRSLLGETLAE